MKDLVIQDGDYEGYGILKCSRGVMGEEFYMYNNEEVSKDHELVVLSYMSTNIYYAKMTIEDIVSTKSNSGILCQDLIDAGKKNSIRVWEIHVIKPYSVLSDTVKRLMTLTEHDGFADHYRDFCNNLDDISNVFELLDKFIEDRNLALMNIKNESPFLAEQAKKAL